MKPGLILATFIVVVHLFVCERIGLSWGGRDFSTLYNAARNGRLYEPAPSVPTFAMLHGRQPYPQLNPPVMFLFVAPLTHFNLETAWSLWTILQLLIAALLVKWASLQPSSSGWPAAPSRASRSFSGKSA
jgi:hypothetical protein